MRWRKADVELRKYVQGRSLRDPADSVRTMLDFYRDVRVKDCAREHGDMLLFQWGIYDWGQGLHFELDVTRQLIGRRSEDDDIWQLRLPWWFAPSEELTALGAGDRWCKHPDELAAFEAYVLGSPAYKAVSSRTDGRLEQSFECAG